ncbi:MAG: hypothetical protein ACRBF0_21745 [Calditrichia bacterium]
MPESKQHLGQEWRVLQQDHERYEQMALIIKLVAVVSCLAAAIYGLTLIISTAIIAVLWLQEGIWKTWQHRTAQRLLEIEKMLLNGSGEAFQFHTRWEADRSGAIGLIVEYISNSMRPTVAFPYVVLLAVLIVPSVLNVQI